MASITDLTGYQRVNDKRVVGRDLFNHGSPLDRT